MNRSDFPILNQTIHNRPLVYLDNAATNQKPQQVIDAISYAYTHFNANIHRGVHYLSQVATKEHENARQTIADFVHAESKDTIVFTKGTTDAINTVAFCIGEAIIQPKDEIIVSALEHHSNIVPWQMVCQRKGAVLKVIPITERGYMDIESIQSFITERTKIISVAYVSNVLGTVQPIEQVIQLAHQHSIPVLIDAAQASAHRPIDVQRLDCDFLVFSGHKMYGPTGIGVLYGKSEWLNRIPPYQGGGEMIEHVSFEHTTYNTLPYKFEAGTPNFIGSYALGKAVEYMSSVGMHTIQAYNRELMAYLEQQLRSIEGVYIYAEGEEKDGVLSFNVYSNNKLIHPFDIGTLLDQQGVAVRTGHHCAEPLMNILHIPGTVRVSIALYNDQNDIDIFISALRKTLSLLQ